MNKRIRIRVVFIGFFWTAVALCGCARREPDMPEEFLLPAEEEAEGDVQAGGRNGEDAYGMTGDTKQDAFTGSEEVSRNGEAGTFTLPGQQECYVYICGAVKEPGVYRMETDARVFAVIDKAGGFAEGACEDYVNQAKPVADCGYGFPRCRKPRKPVAGPVWADMVWMKMPDWIIRAMPGLRDWMVLALGWWTSMWLPRQNSAHYRESVRQRQKRLWNIAMDREILRKKRIL